MSYHIVKILFRVLKAYSVSVSLQEIERAVLTHPEYPSMQSISDALDEWKVKNVVMKLSLERLQTLDVPVIAQLKRGEFVWVTEVTDTDVHYWSASSNKEKIESCDQFEKAWSGVALAIENTTDAGESEYKKVRRQAIKEQVLKSLIIGVFIVLLAALTCFSWIQDSQMTFLTKSLLLSVNAAGCFICYLLIRQEKRQSSNRLIQKFCKAGAHVDCNTVTRSTKPQHFRRRYL